MKAIAVTLALCSPAIADDFVGIDAYGTLGIGVAIDHDPSGITPSASYDAALRLGRTLRATDRWRPGGFVELHGLDLERFDAAIGPQLQFRVRGQVALQLRAGVGLGEDGTHALAGLHFGSYTLGVSATARRWFDTGDVVVALNLEVLALVPVALAIALGADRDQYSL